MTKGKQIIIGREAMSAISAVEGQTLTAQDREMFADFDRRGLTPEQRRQHILAMFNGGKPHAR